MVEELERRIVELKQEFASARQEQYKLKSEKNAVELATRQTIVEVQKQLKSDLEDLDKNV